jgi:hypothetical protein
MKMKLFFGLFIIWFLFIKEEVNPYIDKDNSTYEEIISEISLEEKINSGQPFKFKNWTITLLEPFSMKARVLASKEYTSDKEAELSPIDLALGWDRMSNIEVISKINITQSSRWYHWKTKKFPIPKREIETHSANMHIVPASKDIESKVKNIREGEMVKVTGYLIRADSKDGHRWVSSLTRYDTGNHACEVVFVVKLDRI